MVGNRREFEGPEVGQVKRRTSDKGRDPAFGGNAGTAKGRWRGNAGGLEGGYVPLGGVCGLEGHKGKWCGEPITRFCPGFSDGLLRPGQAGVL